MWFFGVLSTLVVIGGMAAALSQGYAAKDSSVITGMVVRLSSESSASHLVVEAADNSVLAPPLGVVIRDDQSLLAVGSASNSVFITDNGQARVYVSDINGQIKHGDQLTVSPLKGVLQKADSSSQLIMGAALEDFPNSGAKSVVVKGANGKDTSIQSGLVNANISIKPLGNLQQTSQSWLKEIGRSITGHSISEERILAAFIIFVTLLVIEGVVVHGTISSTIAAAGRNPMARGSIEQQSFKGVLIAMVILITGITTIAIMLWA